METETYEVFEWRIENFSYWDKNVHGGSIISPESDLLYHVRRLKLFTNQTLGQMEVRLYPGEVHPLSGGNLSLMCSDGSLICTKRTHNPGWDNMIYCGLRFQDVSARVKNKGDQLILRLCFLSEGDNKDTVITTLDVFEMSLKVDLILIRSMQSGDSETISNITYSKQNPSDEMLLKAVRKNERIEFALEMLAMSRRGVSVEIQWRLESIDKAILGKDEKYLFKMCESFTFSNTYTRDQLVRRDPTLLLKLKIISGDEIQNILRSPRDHHNKGVTMDVEASNADQETDCVIDQDSPDSASSNHSVTSLLKDFMCLYQDQDFSDVTLKCGNITFPVHRAILSARSPVFKTMFTIDMQETGSGRVDITDLDPSTLGLFLTFLYSGDLGKEELQGESAVNLYYAADKYQVPSLKKECADFLCSNVSPSNVCDVLSLGNKYQDDDLRSAAQNFVLENQSEVLKSEEWGRLVKTEPNLVAETLTSFAVKYPFGKTCPQ